MKNIVLILICLFSLTAVNAQDIHFSQFYQSPLLRNPALTGIFTGQWRLQAVFRDQWRSIKGANNGVRPFRTLGAGAEVKLKGYCMDENSLIMGFQVVHDRAGDALLTRTMPMVSLSYRMYLSDNAAITGGFYGGWSRNTFDTDGLQWDDQYVGGQYSPLNPTSQPLPVTEKDYADFGAGVLVSNLASDNHNWYFGAAVHHLNRARVGFAHDSAYRLYPRITFNTGYAVALSDFTSLKLMADVMYQADQYQVMGGFMFTLRVLPDNDVQDDGLSIGIGMLGRLRDAVIPVININMNQFSAGFSYDWNVLSKLSAATGTHGALEFTLRYRGMSKSKSTCETYGCPSNSF